jgi:trans-2,3-dihydro-3-hydroxyanthranilate isomerase
MPLAFLHYDVFTGTPLLGNQLAVFPDARGLDTAAMQAIANEMNFAESTFVVPAEAAGTDVRMRIFTPHVEMPMAGHPTVGSTFALAHLGVIRPGTKRFTFGLNIGPTPVDLDWRDGRLAFAWMTQLPPTFGRVAADRGAVAEALGLGVGDLADGLPIQEISCGVPFLFVPLRDRAAVDRAVSDAAGFKRLAETSGESRPIFLFTVSPAGAPEAAYSRMFAPEFGIVEDPATGSASGPLGCYLVKYGLLVGDAAGAPSATPAEDTRAGRAPRRGPAGSSPAATAPATHRIVSHQGVAMGRASTIHIAIEGGPDAITGVRVGGEAVLVGRGELMV